MYWLRYICIYEFIIIQITAHLDEGKITKIMNLFTQLKTSIEESIADD